MGMKLRVPYTTLGHFHHLGLPHRLFSLAQQVPLVLLVIIIIDGEKLASDVNRQWSRLHLRLLVQRPRYLELQTDPTIVEKAQVLVKVRATEPDNCYDCV